MRACILIIAAVSAGTAANAAPRQAASSSLVGDVQKCRTVSDAAARLACYDRAVTALAAADARGDIKVVDRQSIREVRRSLFGFSVPRLPFFSDSKDKDTQPKKLETTLASIRNLGNDFYRFSIADPESTWDTTEAAFIDNPKRGDKVRFERGAIGNYFVQIGNGSWVSARRVR